MFGSVQLILTKNVCKYHVAAKFMLLTLDQNEVCLCVACGMLECNNAEPDVMKKLTGDETFYGYDAQPKTQLSQ